MNGARSIFMRKGYWLTALAAIVLLAASPGTAQAQIEVTGPDEVTEGGTDHVYRGRSMRDMSRTTADQAGNFTVTVGGAFARSTIADGDVPMVSLADVSDESRHGVVTFPIRAGDGGR